jgi:AraC-like DNA-binding protein
MRDTAAPLLEPGAERVVIFHLITEGECWVDLEDGAPTRLVAGDVVLFPQGDAHVMCSEPGLPPAKGTRLETVLTRRPRQMAYGGGGARTKLICGYLACDARLARMLLGGLPRLVRVNVRGSNAGIWLEASVRYALAEARSPAPRRRGRAGQARRGAVDRGAAPVRERAARGPHRLARRRRRPRGRRRVERAARQARARLDARGTRRAPQQSRSVLAERFQQLVGSSPDGIPHAVAHAAGANLLARSNAPLARIAEDVGYQTDNRVQPRVPARVRRAAGGVAAGPRAPGLTGRGRGFLTRAVRVNRA